MLNHLKNKIRNSFKPIAKSLPLSPNLLTVVGLGISIIAAVMFGTGRVFIGGIFILLNGFFDILDGAVARENGWMTPFGGLLDSVCDRYADAIIFIGIIYGVIIGSISDPVLLNIPLWLWCVVAMIGSYIVSYTRARAEAAGGKDMNIGIAERPERMIILTIGAFVGLLAPAIAVIVIITHITVAQRLLHARNTL
ncbi:CDP-alcohol phosphatidyltransferase family protein [Methanohalobium sp.]|uniref:CDP-alcohol phosphatidyltransferase family protein n=1 Tax=Methanohalobium sp. TaxID=2837493 RepID=UPI0025DC6CE1|nr:CDP-alcohol phosphatidyltransferase family protein [Methanohalobium sp.]